MEKIENNASNNMTPKTEKEKAPPKPEKEGPPKFNATNATNILNVEDSSDKVLNENYKVLIIVTGGTICMFNSPTGFIVKKNYISSFLRENPNFCDADFTYFNSKDDFLITPLTEFNKRVFYKVLEFDHIIDSANIKMSKWVEIATVIEKNYDEYDSFIILHGTDTMAYTASVLSFMLENLGKTIIITGSQVPLSLMRNDAYNNLLNSIIIAGHFRIPEVMILFRGKLLRGCRTKKVDANGLDSFDSPNFEPLGLCELKFNLKWEKMIKLPSEDKKLKVHKNLCENIVILKYNPLLSISVLEAIFRSPETKGIILESYGLGNLPTDNKALMDLIKETNDRGVVILNLSQCFRYQIEAVYETGFLLVQIGVINGFDMTIEAALTKMAFLIGMGLPVEEVKKKLVRSISGEITSWQHEDKFEPPQEEDFIRTMADAITRKSNEINLTLLRNLIIPNIICYIAKYGTINSLMELDSYSEHFRGNDYDKRTALHVSAREGKLDIVKYLLQKQSNVNAVDIFGRTPLFEAANNGHKEIVRELKRANGRLKAPFDDMCEVILNCGKENDVETLELFLEAGLENLNDYVTCDKRNIGHIAVFFNSVDVVSFLKQKTKFDFNCQDRWGKSVHDEANELNSKHILRIIKEK